MVTHDRIAAGAAYPSAAYGKRASTRSRPQEYGLLGRTDDFPPAAVEALDALGRAFRWPGGKTAHAPAFALWPVAGDGGWLAARLLDVGRDDQGRPHLLRVEAVYLAPGELSAAGDAGEPNLARLTGVLSPEAWPQGTTRDGAPIRLAPVSGDSSLAKSLTEAWRGGSVLVIHEAPPDAHAFETTLDERGRPHAVAASRGSVASRPLVAAKLHDASRAAQDARDEELSRHPWLADGEGEEIADDAGDEPSSATRRRSTNRPGATTMARSRWGGGLFYAVALVLAAAGFAAGWYGREWAAWNDATHRRELGERDETIQSLEAEREQIGADVEWMRQQIQKQRKTLSEQQESLDAMARRLNRLSTSPRSTDSPTTPGAE